MQSQTPEQDAFMAWSKEKNLVDVKITLGNTVGATVEDIFREMNHMINTPSNPRPSVFELPED